MLLEPFHQLVDIADEGLRLAQLLQFGIIRLVRDISGVILDINNHGVEFRLVDQVHQCIHPRSARAVGCYVNALDLGCVGLGIWKRCGGASVR
ncbi:hypothetical protein D3C71_1505270 [compost metagenome]